MRQGWYEVGAGLLAVKLSILCGECLPCDSPKSILKVSAPSVGVTSRALVVLSSDVVQSVENMQWYLRTGKKSLIFERIIFSSKTSF